ncbi:hypothetical protein TKK_0002738 [Trichogramma kaykai]|uniref:DNA topoisomerase n=1 Tax=Trichogramma kaykai TaxID=54128 RepID=A0ABD2XSD7_9HYME
MLKLTIRLNILKYFNVKCVFGVSRFFSNAPARFEKAEIMKVLNVAEKNDAAKNIAGHISRGTARRREGLSKYNKIYEFNARVWNRDCQMIMTSVSGHLMSFDFTGAYRKWYGCPPLSLFDAPVQKACVNQDYEKIKKSIEKEVRGCQALIIWTDCDREGENIGYEIIQVARAIKPNIQVYRAKFSEITQASIERALQNLEQPNQLLSDAVDVRSELDLRIGAAFTRFQTMRLQKAFPRNLSEMLISYGPCQFPTLGFVVERFLAIERFEPEPYWKLKVTHTMNDLTVDFRWSRNRLFEKLPCEVFLDICQDNPQATVEKITSKPKSKWRPLPLDTIELEKQGSRKLRLSAKETMKIAEKLYTQGFISYPRTETNIFPKEMNLTALVTQQAPNQEWGNFAQRLLEEGVNPRQGKKSDQAHPPIHPTKYADNLHGDEKRVYEYVVRHFLACCSKDAQGYETVVEINIAGETFITNGLQIIAKNYLEVYIYERWNAKEIHIYENGQTFMPTSIDMLEESTSPPNLLTEADLIALMDKHGIGTDATHAEHIETIKSRQYVGLKDNKYLIPGKLGIGLVMGYDRMGFQMSKPNLRAELENDLKLICEGQKQPDEVRQRIINKYREVFREALTKANMIDTALAEYLDERPAENVHQEIAMPVDDPVVLKCPKCDSNMTVKARRQGNGKYIGCMNYPTCNNVIWLPESVEDVEVLNERCNICPDNILRKIKVKLQRHAYPALGISYTACVGGCDDMFNNVMGIRIQSVRRARDLPNNGANQGPNRPNNPPPSPQPPRGPPPPQPPRGPPPPRQRPPPPSPQARNPRNNRNDWDSDDNDWTPGTGSTQRNQNYSTYSSSAPSNNWNSNRSEIKSFNSAPSSSRPNNQWSQGNGWTGSSSSNRNNDDSHEIMCNCHQTAKLLTVRKEGPNQGRQFYKCAKPSGDCGFFLWDPESGGGSNSNVGSSAPRMHDSSTSWNQNNRQNNYQAPSNHQRRDNNQSFNSSNNWDDWSGGGGGGGNNDNEQVMCTCGQPGKKLTVNKEGPNKGRKFYGCPQGPGSSCNFFKWADDVSDNNWGGPPPPGGGRGRGRGGGAASRGRGASRPAGDGGAGSKRKCGNCGIVGHTKRTCPQND